MNHDIRIAGDVFALRPVEIGDAAFILALRTDPGRARFLTPTSPRLADQAAWLNQYLARAGDYYFIIEQLRSGERAGTIAIYNEDPDTKCAEWGRWIVRVGSRAGIEGLLLLYRIAFEVLALEMVYSRTEAANTHALALHQGYGLEPYAYLPSPDARAGDRDAIEHRMTRARWRECEPVLRRMAAEAARRGGPSSALDG